VVAFVGVPTFKTSMRGFAPTPAKDFVEALAKVLRVIMLGEAYTSQRDWLCAAMLTRVSKTTHRHWRCDERPDEMQNKDFVACLSLLRIGLLLRRRARSRRCGARSSRSTSRR
jgi:hypothetical protein